MTLTATDRRTTTVSPTPSTPRLRLAATAARRTLLDGGWWPRSTDPVAELPGLVLAIEKLHGPVTHLVLSSEGWDAHPRRLNVAGRILRLGYFTSQSPSLLTALCRDNERVDLLVVAPETADVTADAAMAVAASSGNLVHAPQILRAVGAAKAVPVDGAAEDAWEAEGGQPAGASGHRARS
jgi:hypothetical protein